MLESNSNAEQLGIYAGVAGGGLIAGSAIVARATSPIYKKDKKTKKAQGNNSPVPTGDVDKAAAVVAPPKERRASQRAMHRRDQAAATAVTKASSGTRSGRHNKAVSDADYSDAVKAKPMTASELEHSQAKEYSIKRGQELRADETAKANNTMRNANDAAIAEAEVRKFMGTPEVEAQHQKRTQLDRAKQASRDVYANHPDDKNLHKQMGKLFSTISKLK